MGLTFDGTGIISDYAMLTLDDGSKIAIKMSRVTYIGDQQVKRETLLYFTKEEFLNLLARLGKSPEEKC